MNRNAVALCSIAWLSVSAIALGESPPDDKAGLEVLTKAAQAMKDSKSFTAGVDVEGIGGRARIAPTSGTIALRRDAQGTSLWHFAARGESLQLDGTRLAVAGGYDGTAVRVLQPRDKKLVETDRGSIALLEEDGSSVMVAWATRWDELVAGPLKNAEDAGLRLNARALVNNVLCEVVYVDYSALETSDTPLMDAWWYVGVEDSLPRRVELHYYDEDRGDGFVRITLRDLKRDASVSDADLVIATPDGFTLEKRATPKAAPRQRGGAAGPASNPLGIGSMAPEWTLKDAAGKDVNLKDYRGKVVVLDFWATWCPPCRAAMPRLQEIHEKYSSKGVAVIGMNMSESGDAPGYMKENGFTYGLVLNAEQVAPQYRVSGIPHFVVIGPDGTVVHAGVGFGKGTEEGIVNAIEGLLERPK